MLPQSYQDQNLSEGADRVGGQLRGDEECPFSGVPKSGRVWRKVPENDARSVRETVGHGYLYPLQMTQDLIVDYDAKMLFTKLSTMDVTTNTAAIYKVMQDFNTVSGLNTAVPLSDHSFQSIPLSDQCLTTVLCPYV